MKFAKAIIIAMTMVFSLQSAIANILTDKSTYIGNDAVKPENPFLVCAVQKSVAIAYGDTRKVLAYAYSAAVGDNRPPEIAMVVFATQNTDSAKRNSLQLHLKSLDSQKKWQFVGTDSEIYLFSTKVDSVAELKDSENNLVTKVDISECN